MRTWHQRGPGLRGFGGPVVPQPPSPALWHAATALQHLMDEGSHLEEIYATCDECTQLGVQLGSSESPARPPAPPARARPFARLRRLLRGGMHETGWPTIGALPARHLRRLQPSGWKHSMGCPCRPARPLQWVASWMAPGPSWRRRSCSWASLHLRCWPGELVPRR